MHSAEWLRGVVAVLGRMVDECQTVFDSDLPHITEGNLEDYLAEYSHQLAEAESRESGEPGMAEQLAAAQAEAKQWRDKCRVTQAKLENMAIDCGQAEGLLKRCREEAAQLRQQAEAARLAEGE